MRVKKFPKFAVLLVTWKDITSDPRWRNAEEQEQAEAILIKTVGFFLRNKKRELHLASDVSSDGDSDVKAIPYGVIENIEVIHDS
jgi:hypothetical protein